MHTTINGIYENGHIILDEIPIIKKRMKVLITFVEEGGNGMADGEVNTKALYSAEQNKTNASKQTFSERWQGKFKLNNRTDDERFDYLQQRYQL